MGGELAAHACEDIMSTIVLPRLGTLFRCLVTSAGYRSLLAESGLDKDLDDLALDARPGSSADLLLGLENAVARGLANDSGVRWSRLLRWAWRETRNALQKVVREVDTTPIPAEEGREAFHVGFAVPMLSGLVRLASTEFPGIDLDKWWVSPMAAWVEAAAALLGGAEHEDEVISRLHDTPRTTERWMAGKPVGELRHPFRRTVLLALGPHGETCPPDRVDMLTGWLTLTVAVQSLPEPERDALRRNFGLRQRQPWNLDDFVATLQRRSHAAGDRQVRAQAMALLQQVQQGFSSRPRDLYLVERHLADFRHLLDQEPDFWRQSYQNMHHRFSGRLAALQGRDDDALYLYAAAVDGVWWRGGPNQHLILREALLHAVGVGDLVRAKRYWDRTFMLGLNRWPKKALDEQERRRLAFSFERDFAPCKAKDRIPPGLEIMEREGPFGLTAEQLKHPNKKVKHAEGRTRRTPLMDAVREGTLADVERALAAGGDPDDYIKESGEGPLSYAMRRACDRHDPAIMEHLLKLELSLETVNRPASTSRETPLKIAIEMADAAAVERLIVLGADVERACSHMSSALCYAMMLLHESIHTDDRTQEHAYLAGRTGADVHDAKDGVALDADLVARRQRLATLRDASSENRAIFDAVMQWRARPPEPRRRVVSALLEHGANPNRRYKVERGDLAEWTPTLVAAQIGDLAVFRSLIEHGGDPDLLLMQTSSLDRRDAMWVAVIHQQRAIIDLLVERTRSCGVR